MFSEEDIGEPIYTNVAVIPYVGRVREREEIKTFLKKQKYRIFHVTGAPNVGKERFVYQVCDELEAESHETKTHLRVVKISCRYINTWHGFVKTLESSLSGKCSSDLISVDEIIKMIQECSDKDRYLILAFTKVDDILSSNLSQLGKLCNDILDRSRNVFVILSSQIRVVISHHLRIRHVLLKKLDSYDAISLLRLSANDLDFAGLENKIVCGCQCMPGLILEAANLLVNNEGIINGDSLAEMLRCPETALTFFSSALGPPEEQLKAKIEKLISRLPSKLQTSVHDISLFKGSFSSEAFHAVLGHERESDSNFQVMMLRNASVLEFDKDRHLFSLNPLIKSYLDLNTATMPCSDLAKLRFVKFFVDTMVVIDNKLYKDSHKNIKDYFHHDYENVCQVMQHAIHCTDNVFEALMQAVCEAEEIFIKCFPVEKVKEFYLHLLTAAEHHGKPEQIAILKMFLAQAMTQMKVDDHIGEVTQLFTEAFKLLSWKQPGYHHMTLLGFLGRFHVRQGRFQKGLRLIQSALTMKVSGATKSNKVHRRILEFLVQRALAEVFRENYEQAEETLNEALNVAQKEAPYHSAVSVIFNTFGLINDRSGRDGDKALQWYRSSLEERRKFADLSPEMLVVPLNNIAWQSLKRGNTGYALKLIEEALNIRKKCGWNDYFTSLTLKQKADIYLVQGKLQEAIGLCDEAYKICQECTPRHYFINDIRFSRFHCQFLAKNLSSAKEDYCKMISDRERYTRDTERGEQTMDILLHGLLLSEGDQWDNAYNELQEEVRRLRDLALQRNDFDKYIILCQIINANSHLFTSRRLDDKDTHQRKCVSLVVRHCKVCSMIPNATVTMLG